MKLNSRRHRHKHRHRHRHRKLAFIPLIYQLQTVPLQTFGTNFWAARVVARLMLVGFVNKTIGDASRARKPEAVGSCNLAFRERLSNHPPSTIQVFLHLFIPCLRARRDDETVCTADVGLDESYRPSSVL